MVEELLKEILLELKKHTMIFESQKDSIYHHDEKMDEGKNRIFEALKEKNPQLAEMFNIFMGGK